MKSFYIGTWQVKHIEKTTHPLMVSYRWLKNRKKEIKQKAPLALDSGGFTELEKNGEWTITAQKYTTDVRRLRDEIGLQFDFVAPQDWMCEPHMIEKTGLSVKKHQELTVKNYIELKQLAPDLPIIPVLQGFQMDEYKYCFELYLQNGIDLRNEPLVGLGSVCRRQNTDEIADIIKTFSTGKYNLKIHAFGIKKGGLLKSKENITSADSMAWSFRARKDELHSERSHCVKLPDCASSCRNCLNFALSWAKRIGASV